MNLTFFNCVEVQYIVMIHIFVMKFTES